MAPNIVPILTCFDGDRWMIYWRNEDNILGVTNLFDLVYEKNVSRDEKATILNVAKTLADKSWIEFMCAEGWQITKADDSLAKVGIELLIQRASWSPEKKKPEVSKSEATQAAPPGKGRRAAQQRRLLGLNDWDDEEQNIVDEKAEIPKEQPKESTPKPEKATGEQNRKEEEKPTSSRVAQAPTKLLGKRSRKPAQRERNASSAEFMDDEVELGSLVKEVSTKKTLKKKNGNAAG
ncbi:unnamed protein product, partial [Mesorhabditis belari]|uniref:Uncharacterized protein n=1 Tax=Mesorhabditis belari TaxID=2138241 RepID=A0AAF3J708_9BILA